MRLDLYTSQQLWVSRNRAQFFIQREKIKVNTIVMTKSSYFMKETDVFESNIDEINYVSRSALKLKGFIENEKLKIDDFVCLDIWSSTGWFTQLLLEKNVKKVYSVDVGTCQLHEKLRNNPKIVSIENTDIRKLKKSFIKEKLDLIVCDVSFISLHIIIDSIISLMDNKTITLLLFKPQFEVWSENLTKLWIPKNENIINKKMSYFFLILRKKWVNIVLVKNSILTWENWNKETFIFIQK